MKILFYPEKVFQVDNLAIVSSGALTVKNFLIMVYVPKQDAKTVIISATLIRETPKAYMFDCEGDEVWFPKSQVTFDVKNSSVEVPTWLLDQNNLKY